MLLELSKWFFTEFNKLFTEEGGLKETATRCYTSNTEFTGFIIPQINRIIKSKGYCSQNEYYRIDAMGYTVKEDERKKLGKEKSFALHLWDLEVAVEHENDPVDWLDEVIKLAHISCPLRVVIGYVPVCQRPDIDLQRLDYATKALKLLKCGDNLKHGEFMIILGNSHTKCPQEYFHYVAYVLNRETMSFEKLVNL